MALVVASQAYLYIDGFIILKKPLNALTVSLYLQQWLKLMTQAQLP